MKLPARIRAAQRTNERAVLRWVRYVNALPYVQAPGLMSLAWRNAIDRLMVRGVLRFAGCNAHRTPTHSGYAIVRPRKGGTA